MKARHVVGGCCGVMLLASSGLSAALLHPEAPRELGSNAEPEAIRLEWEPSSSPEVVGYSIYRSVVATVADPATRLNAEPVRDPVFLDEDVVRGALFCYTVRAVSNLGLESPDSNEVCATFKPNASGFFKRGDVDGDGTMSITDPISLLSHLFLGGERPGCLDAADFDDSGTIEVSDAVANLSYQFLGTGAPPAPGPDACGFDETPDGDVELGCNGHLCELLGT